MNKKVNLVKYIVAFVIPVLVMGLVSAWMGFYPFGTKSVFIMDMQDQYLEFYASLRYMFTSDNSVFFSWSRSMGGSYVGLLVYYIASPLSWLTVLFPLEQLSIAIWLMTMIKIGLCGVTFYSLGKYLLTCEHTGHKDCMLLLLATGYALCSYNMVYSMCPMWLDGVIFLPLIIKGLLQIVRRQKAGALYMYSLAAAIICNYYIGYMLCIFVVLFYFFLLFQNDIARDFKEKIRLTLQVLLKSILAVGLTMPLMIPNLISLRQGKMAGSVTFFMCRNFHLWKIWRKFLPGGYDSIKNEGLPSIYCGLFALVLLLLFFVSKNTKKREKIGAAVVLVFLMGSFYACPVDMIWHGFHYPIWFPYRYAFVFSFFLLYLACKKLNEMTWKPVSGVLVLICVLSLIDLTCNSYAMLHGLDQEFTYLENQTYVDYIDSTGKLVADVKKSDSDFYRMNENYEFSKNDALLLGYNGLTHYSSTYNEAVNSFCKSLGMAQSQIWNSGYGSTPLIDALFSVKYVLDHKELPESYALHASSQETGIYVNSNWLPIAYAVQKQEENPDMNAANPFDNQNTWIRQLTGLNKDCFESLDWEQSVDMAQDGTYTITYRFQTQSKNPVYLFMQSADAGVAEVYVNNKQIGQYFTSETSCSLYLGEFLPGEEIDVKLMMPQEAKMDAVYISQFQMETFQEHWQMLAQSPLQISKHGAARIEGTIHVDENQQIMTSIPYDEGWHVYIDGKETEIGTYAGAFITLNTTAGEHSVVFKYVASGFWTGMVLFVVSFIGTIVVIRKRV